MLAHLAGSVSDQLLYIGFVASTKTAQTFSFLFFLSFSLEISEYYFSLHYTPGY